MTDDKKNDPKFDEEITRTIPVATGLRLIPLGIYRNGDIDTSEAARAEIEAKFQTKH